MNSRVILAKNILVDRNYNNVLSYNNDEMLSLLRSNNHFINEANDYQFIQFNKTIRVNFSYNQCLQANYIAFQNPKYSNKWFFAFIDSIAFKSDFTTEISFTIDEWSTWFSFWTPKTCYTLREHVNDDTIGKHTYPEDIETGEYTHSTIENFGVGKCHAIILLSEDIFKGEGNYPYQEMNGIPTGLHYYLVGDFTSVNFIGYCTTYAVDKSLPDLIQGVFMAPDILTGYNVVDWDYALSEGSLNYAPYKKLSDSTSSILMQNFTTTKKYDNIDDYIPKNNKLFVHPFNYFYIDNNNGLSYDYRYEDFTNNVEFKVMGSITPGCSIRAIPQKYKNIESNNSEGIVAGKLPIGSYSVDMYTNWLRQNGLNTGLSAGTNILQVAGGIGLLASGAGTLAGVGTIAGGVSGILQNINSVYQHSLTPRQVMGNTNAGDVTYSSGLSTFTLYKTSVKNEYAKIIDDFFTRFGYKVNIVKVPNIYGRSKWNFVQIGQGEEIGYSNNIISVPSNSMTSINNSFAKGVTIWHNHDDIGNFNLDNNII